MDYAKKWHGMELNSDRSVLVKAVRKSLSLRRGYAYEDSEPLDMKQSLSGDQWRAVITRKAYWDTHDVPTISLIRRVFIQYYLRLSQWAFESMRRAMWSPADSKYQGRKPFMAALNFLVDICCHEYDVIRKAGRNTFNSVAGSFVGAGNYIIKRLLSTELNVNNAQKATFGSASGAMKLLQRPYSMRRVLGSWNLSILFFDTLRAMPALIAQIEADEAKKEQLVGVVAATFVHYIPQWFNVPVPPNADVKGHLSSALEKVGYSSEAAMDVDSAGAGAGVSGGIRFETFNSYVVMATIGHPDVEVPAQAWTWALKTVATQNGQPSQQLAYSALCRLATLRKKKAQVLREDTDTEVRSLLACSKDNAGLWTQLLQGLSAVHPKAGEEGNAQWSGGVETALKYAGNYTSVSSHKRYSLAFDSNVVSPYFQREASVLFFNLFSSGLLGLGLTSSEGPLVLQTLLTIAKESLGEGASDEEARSNNAAHSELFGGLLRAVLESASSSAFSMVDVLLRHY